MKVEIREDKVLIEGYVNAVGRDSRVIPSPTGILWSRWFPKPLSEPCRRDMILNCA